MKPPFLPQFLISLFARYNHDHLMLGDLEEEYHDLAQSVGLSRAKIWYWKQALLSIIPYILNTIHWSGTMFKSYLKTAFRSLKRSKGYSFINITGLSFGLAISLVLLMWINDELSFDTFHGNYSDIYKIICKNDQILNDFDGVPGRLGEEAKLQIPEIINSVRVIGEHRRVFQFGENNFYEKGGIRTESSFFEIFDFPFTKGDPKTALESSDNIVITENMARRYFGGQDPLGQIFQSEGQLFTITGVIKDIPANSHIQFDYLLPINLDKQSWSMYEYVTYLLTNGVKNPDVGNQLSKIAVDNNSSQAVYYKIAFVLEPFSDVHLKDKNQFRHWSVIASEKNVYIFSVIALLILLIACVNYINLSTARSTERALEVALRKTVGASRKNLMWQFFGESFITVILASLFALFIAYLILPVFNSISGKILHLDIFQAKFILGFISLITIVGIITGLYPAVDLSSFRPSYIFGGKIKIQFAGSGFRKVLVIMQFSITILLIFATFAIRDQINYMTTKDLGFSKENRLYIPLKGNLTSKYDLVKEELLNHPGIQNVSAQNYSFAETQRWIQLSEWEGREPDQLLSIIWSAVDFDFFETLEIEIIEGRKFQREYKKDGEFGIIINETAVEKFGFEDPIGKSVTVMGTNVTVVGVIEDVHFKSLEEQIAPHFFYVMGNKNNSSELGVMVVNMTSNQVNNSTSIDYIKSVWEKINPDMPFEYRYIDEAYSGIYNSQNNISNMLDYFTVFALFISCLGLFGLASFMAAQRAKEIGIRKVLGATMPGVLRLLLWEFILLIIVSCVIALPTGYYFLNLWLEGFAYKMSIEPRLFLFAAFTALLFAIIASLGQTLKAAYSNPVDSLKNE